MGHWLSIRGNFDTWPQVSNGPATSLPTVASKGNYYWSRDGAIIMTSSIIVRCQAAQLRRLATNIINDVMITVLSRDQ